ncbi:hypothetical protein ABEB36_014477 [Hypothenemus hampei]|uniref:Uncharacterized protein n=1 Tax=Hypothenemus hampei TaxID=57062 RepID=A0ABD1E1Y5_HYPHA
MTKSANSIIRSTMKPKPQGLEIFRVSLGYLKSMDLLKDKQKFGKNVFQWLPCDCGRTVNVKDFWTQDMKTRNLELQFAFLESALRLILTKLQPFENNQKIKDFFYIL